MSSVGDELFGGSEEMSRIFYGANAVHVPAWLYVQNQGTEGGTDVVSFVGASRMPGVDPHPLRYGSQRTHQFVLGEIIVRPHIVVATDTLRGYGLGGLATSGNDIRRMLADGEIVVKSASVIRALREAGELP